MFVTCYESEKSIMFDYMRLDLSKSNQELINLRNKIESLKTELSNNKKYLSLTSL